MNSLNMLAMVLFGVVLSFCQVKEIECHFFHHDMLKLDFQSAGRHYTRENPGNDESCNGLCLNRASNARRFG